MAGERVLRWESAQRYYAARVHQDLLGDWILDIAYGGLYNQLGHVETVLLASAGAADGLIADIHSRRTKHRYNLVVDVQREQ